MSIEDKHPDVIEMMDKMSKSMGGPGVTKNLCALCGHKVSMSEFRDSLSLKEWNISRMCMSCQDSIFG